MSISRARKPAFFVATSPIHGRGVFAAKRLPRGVRIATYKGPARWWSSLGERRRSLAHTMYFSLPDGKRVIDGRVATNPARFLNHCCAPNVEAVHELGRVRFYTLRRIEPGHELSIDYRFDAPPRTDRRARRAMRCRCGAAVCRGAMFAG